MHEMKLPISSLCDTDSAKRQNAAREIFARGVELARTATEKWFADAEFEGLLVSGNSGLASAATVGIAVEPGTFERIRSTNGRPRLADVPPEYDAREFELEFPGGVRIDVLTTGDPSGVSGALGKYLEKFGEGIQQVEIDVRDVEIAIRILRTRFGLESIYPAVRAGAGNTRVNFFLAPMEQGGKILIELVERGLR
jgi:hypothetical protein